MKRPRNERNFWITLEVDGLKTKIACGPKSKDGGFTMKVFMRGVSEEKWEEPALIVTGTEDGGQLTLKAHGMLIAQTSRDYNKSSR